MERALVLNEIRGIDHVTGCRFWHPTDAFVATYEMKKLHEKQISEKLSSLADDGFEFKDDKVFAHNLYVANEEDDYTGYHGVYRYEQTGTKGRYKAYFGPLILIPEKTQGCKLVLKKLGCNFGGLGCKLKLGYLGCRSQGGNVQYLNFKDDSINEEIVQKLNKHFDIDKSHYNKENDDYRFYSDNAGVVLAELVKEHYEELLAKYIEDVNEFAAQGYGFEKLIDTPSTQGLYTQAMLFSDQSSKTVTFANKEAALKHITFLHRFDVWYFPVVKGLLRRIAEHLPVIGRFFRKKEEILPTSILEDKNLARLEQVYTDDLNAQSAERKIVEANIAALSTKIPVTIAIRKKQSWWDRIWFGKDYEYFTFFVNGVEAK